MRGLVVFLLAISLVGCTSVSLETIRTWNRENLVRLSVGMSKDDVLQVMGNKTITTTRVITFPSKADIKRMERVSESEAARRINNPYRVETLKGKDGQIHQVLFYYTDLKKVDGAITDDELTPIVLLDEKVVGWGWGFLNENISKYHMQIDVR